MATVVDSSAQAEISRLADLMREVMRQARSNNQDDWVTLSLTRAQIRILFTIHCQGPLPVGRLAAILGITLPSVTTTIDRLVKHELVERQADPADRRKVINALTVAGTQLVERLQQGRRARLIAAIECLAPAERIALDVGLDGLRRALKEMGD